MVNYFCNSLDSALKKGLVDLTALEGSAIKKLKTFFDERIAERDKTDLTESDVVAMFILTLSGEIEELEKCEELLKMWLR